VDDSGEFTCFVDWKGSNAIAMPGEHSACTIRLFTFIITPAYREPKSKTENHKSQNP
jgi:hypothetical protein